MRPTIIPLYNLHAHNILTNVITDANTDAKIAKFRPTGIEFIDVGLLELVEVWRNKGQESDGSILEVLNAISTSKPLSIVTSNTPITAESNAPTSVTSEPSKRNILKKFFKRSISGGPLFTRISDTQPIKANETGAQTPIHRAIYAPTTLTRSQSSSAGESTLKSSTLHRSPRKESGLGVAAWDSMFNKSSGPSSKGEVVNDRTTVTDAVGPSDVNSKGGQSNNLDPFMLLTESQIREALVDLMQQHLRLRPFILSIRPTFIPPEPISTSTSNQHVLSRFDAVDNLLQRAHKYVWFVRQWMHRPGQGKGRFERWASFGGGATQLQDNAPVEKTLGGGIGLSFEWKIMQAKEGKHLKDMQQKPTAGHDEGKVDSGAPLNERDDKDRLESTRWVCTLKMRKTIAGGTSAPPYTHAKIDDAQIIKNPRKWSTSK